MCNSTLFSRKLRVLVIDGHADSRDLLTVFFEQYGIETIAATCISEALTFIQQTCPDLLISEIVLPDGDGYSLISKVKDLELDYGVEIPSIALTACAQENDRTHALAAGFCKHLSKPLDLDELIAAVASVAKHAEPMVTGTYT